jgi:hypothetical protein
MTAKGLAPGLDLAAVLGLSADRIGWSVAVVLPVVFLVGIVFVLLAERDR